nr:uncharacterized protein LOC129472656 isoform X3 [Symphalangus syndactylus]
MTKRKKMKKLLHLCIGPSQFWTAGYGTSNQGYSRNAKHQRARSIPLQDQHLALAILLELAVQRGTLRTLKPKKKHRRKKNLMNRKRMPQHFIETGLHWIKTLLIQGSVSLLANSVCLLFSSYNSFVVAETQILKFPTMIVNLFLFFVC